MDFEEAATKLAEELRPVSFLLMELPDTSGLYQFPENYVILWHNKDMDAGKAQIVASEAGACLDLSLKVARVVGVDAEDIDDPETQTNNDRTAWVVEILL